MKWITPYYLVFMLGAWLVTDGWQVIALKHIDPAAQVTFLSLEFSQITFIWLVRAFLVAAILFINFAVWWAWRNRSSQGVDHARA